MKKTDEKDRWKRREGETEERTEEKIGSRDRMERKQEAHGRKPRGNFWAGRGVKGREVFDFSYGGGIICKGLEWIPTVPDDWQTFVG